MPLGALWAAVALGSLARAAATALRRSPWPRGAPGTNPFPTQLLLDSRPLAWLHVPKTGGGSLGNEIIHTPAVCPLLPKGLVINASRFCEDCNAFNDGILKHFKWDFPLNEYCKGSLFKWTNHKGLSNETWAQNYRGHGFTMLRNPEARLVSSWHHNRHDWPSFMEEQPPQSLREYAELLQGCTVRMLNRVNASKGNYCGLPGLPTPSEVETAKRRLDGFVFVGLVEHWNLSMCLWRAMFGGLCYGADFTNIRPGNSSAEMKGLEGFVDRFDGAVYAKGKEIFERNLREYGVNESSCQPCYAHAAEHPAP